MATYTIHLPPAGTPEPASSEGARFLREGGSLLALLFPALWLLFNRFWFGLVLYLLFALAVAILARLTGSAGPAVIGALPALYLWLEGRQLLRDRLERKGWRPAGLVEADSEWEAELRYYSAQAAPAVPPAPRPVVAASPGMAAEPAPSIGIF